jgi:CDP-diacylglycerol--glycerol-3-phosphate 3-phosphatidyltransferase
MNAFNRKTLLNVPNLLTYGWIAIVPVVMFFMLIQGPDKSFTFNRDMALVAAFFFIIAGISDIVDGYYARKMGQVSLMGKFVDPVADKLIHMAVMIVMVEMGNMPAWLVVLHMSRELLVSGLRSVAAGEGIIIAAGDSGKKKTAWLNVGLASLIIHYPLFGASSYTFGWFCMAVATLYSIYSGLEYFYLFYKQVSSRKS